MSAAAALQLQLHSPTTLLLSVCCWQGKDAEALLLVQTLEGLRLLGFVRCDDKPYVIDPLDAFNIAVDDLHSILLTGNTAVGTVAVAAAAGGASPIYSTPTGAAALAAGLAPALAAGAEAAAAARAAQAPLGPAAPLPPHARTAYPYCLPAMGPVWGFST
jgi:hypothetical protein